LNGEIAAIRTSLEAETASVRERMTSIEARLDALVVGGLVLEWIGL
jgi:hypothetical protein